MLVSAKEMLTKAKAGKYAVGQFNINNLEWTKAILQTGNVMRRIKIHLPIKHASRRISRILSADNRVLG